MQSIMKMLVSCLFLCLTSEAAKILVAIPTPSVSHQVVFRPLYQELAKRGHEVTVITADPAFPKGETPENLTEIDVHEISYNEWRHQILSSETTSGDKNELYNQAYTVFNIVARCFEKQMQTDGVQKLIRNKVKFDLLILEAFAKPALSLTHIFKAPTIVMSSFGSIRDEIYQIGAPTHPKLLHPYCLHQRVYNLTLWEKIETIYKVYRIERFFAALTVEEDKIIKRIFGSDMPSIEDLNKNVDMIFYNIHSIWEMNRPVPPNVIYIGGIHKRPSKELPKELKSYLDSSENGTIYVSFGTNVSPSQLPKEKIEIFVKVFSQLPYDVLWKWDADKLEGRTDNIRTEKWLPQSDLLKHPKIKLFITQGGLQSADEAFIAGVPMIGIPMFGDQWYNVEQFVHHKIGRRIDMEYLSEELLSNAINDVLNDESYRKNVAKLRSVMVDQPQSALDRAVWWAEHVIKHGGARHLRTPTANMSWAEYLDLELLSAVLITLLTVIALAVIFVVKVFRLLLSYKIKVD